MGAPFHYSVELPQRCLQLIEELWPHASKIRQSNQPHLGPLTSTFLISMSMPIINLPIERIERQHPQQQGYADDRHINQEAVKEIDRVIRRQTLGEAPFFSTGVWQFVQLTNAPFPNIAEPLSEGIGEQLSSEDASLKAAQMPASQWVSILRNALAHGGIAYLDEHGRSTYGNPVKMYAFVSGKYRVDSDTGIDNLVALNFLRITEDNYLTFLQKWVAWLHKFNLES